MTSPSTGLRIGPLQAACAGAVLGAVFGAWTAAAHKPQSLTVNPAARPPDPPACPADYARAPDLDPGTEVEGARARWVARCDPRVSAAALSESLELLWGNEVYLDAQAMSSALGDFVRAIADSNGFSLEPLPSTEEVTVAGARGFALDVDGAYRLPPLAVRVWVLPAGPHTLQVTLLAPRARVDREAEKVRTELDHVQGLRAFTPEEDNRRGWTLQAHCPEGFTDATPENGGTNLSQYVGRYCLSPGADGGVELTFAELPTRVDSDAALRNLLELSAHTYGLTGVSTGAGFSPGEDLTVGAVRGKTALLDIDPPPARVHLRAYALPSSEATVYALGTSMHDHAPAVREALDRWLADTGKIRAYDPRALADFKLARTVRTILVPAALTAVLAAVGVYLKNRP